MMTPTRLFDLCRFARGFLYDAEVLTEEEYAELCADHESLGRLEAAEADARVQVGDYVTWDDPAFICRVEAGSRLRIHSVSKDTGLTVGQVVGAQWDVEVGRPLRGRARFVLRAGFAPAFQPPPMETSTAGAAR